MGLCTSQDVDSDENLGHIFRSDSSRKGSVRQHSIDPKYGHAYKGCSVYDFKAVDESGTKTFTFVLSETKKRVFFSLSPFLS